MFQDFVELARRPEQRSPHPVAETEAAPASRIPRGTWPFGGEARQRLEHARDPSPVVRAPRTPRPSR